MKGHLRRLGAISLFAQSTCALSVVLNDAASVKSTASTIAYGLLKYYTGNNTGDVAGNLPNPYFWWEAGAMFGTLIDYWALTGDSTYNDVTTQALLHQVGTDNDFMPANQTRTEGNDDQGFWGMAAMSAAENNFPNPPADQPQWLALAQAVFNEFTTRWDTGTCNGGLRWQIFTFNNGYDYKNSISNGCFFNIAARLARFTGNQTYADWATKVFAWEQASGLMTADYQVYDGANVANGQNCTAPDMDQWTYNHGVFLHGAAVMYNSTNGSTTWKTHVDGLLQSTIDIFFANNSMVMVEQKCEATGQCDVDQQSFKGYLVRWLAGTTQMAPYTFATISPYLNGTAVAAAQACTGSPPTGFQGVAGTACGFSWTTNSFDGKYGVGEQMNALSAVMYTLVRQTVSPVTATTGGTSQGNVNAGMQPMAIMNQLPLIPTGERVAAGFLTTAIVGSLLGGSIFVVK